MKIVIDVIVAFIETVIFILLLILAFVLVTSKFSLFNIKSYVVVSGSMEPVVPTGGIVFVDMGDKRYKLGDVITFNRGKLVVTHRIVKVSKGSFITKGDANAQPDTELVSRSSIIGKAIYEVPKLGYFINFVKSRTGFLFLIIIPTLIFVVLELLDIKEEYKKQVEKDLLARLNLQ